MEVGKFRAGGKLLKSLSTSILAEHGIVEIEDGGERSVDLIAAPLGQLSGGTPSP